MWEKRLFPLLYSYFSLLLLSLPYLPPCLPKQQQKALSLPGVTWKSQAMQVSKQFPFGKQFLCKVPWGSHGWGEKGAKSCSYGGEPHKDQHGTISPYGGQHIPVGLLGRKSGVIG